MRTKTQIYSNHGIRYDTVRLVDQDSSEVLKTDAAIKRACNQGLDLILINDQEKPPICKITDLNKYCYEQQQKEKGLARSRRERRIDIKEVQFKINIDNHDFETKCKNVKKFISKGNRVKVVIRFRGREKQHPELGYNIIDRVFEIVEGIEFESKPQMSNDRLTMILKGNKNVAKKSE